jgi:biotin transport system substrate-specific component
MTILDKWTAARGDIRPATSLFLVVIGTLALTLSAKYQVPLAPVPMSMQSLVAIGLGFALGPVLGGAAVLAYLAQGALGLPVFAGTPQHGLGLGYMMGPTGGYLLGFLLAAVTAGALTRAGWARGLFGAVAVALAATAVLYLAGLLWLGAYIGFNEKLLHAGLYPFLLGDAIKVVLAGLAVSQIERAVARRG